MILLFCLCSWVFGDFFSEIDSTFWGRFFYMGTFLDFLSERKKCFPDAAGITNIPPRNVDHTNQRKGTTLVSPGVRWGGCFPSGHAAPAPPLYDTIVVLLVVSRQDNSTYSSYCSTTTVSPQPRRHQMHAGVCVRRFPKNHCCLLLLSLSQRVVLTTAGRAEWYQQPWAKNERCPPPPPIMWNCHCGEQRNCGTKWNSKY